MDKPLQVEIDTPFIAQGTTLRLRDDQIPRAFVPLEVTSFGRRVLEGSAAGIYDDYEADNGRIYLLGLHCRILDQEFQCYLRSEHDRSYTVYRIDQITPAKT